LWVHGLCLFVVNTKEWCIKLLNIVKFSCPCRYLRVICKYKIYYKTLTESSVTIFKYTLPWPQYDNFILSRIKNKEKVLLSPMFRNIRERITLFDGSKLHTLIQFSVLSKWWRVWSIAEMILRWDSGHNGRKTHPITSLSTTCLTWTNPGSDLGLHGERP